MTEREWRVLASVFGFDDWHHMREFANKQQDRDNALAAGWRWTLNREDPGTMVIGRT